MEDQPMTETATLPGLETVDTPIPEGKPTRWIERGPQKRLMLFSGSSNRELAERMPQPDIEHQRHEIGWIQTTDAAFPERGESERPHAGVDS